MKKLKNILFLLLFLCFSFSSDTHNSETVVIIGFIHGAMGIDPTSLFQNFRKFWNDQIEGSLYKAIVEEMRKDSFFYENQPIQAVGLHPLKHSLRPGNAADAIAVLYENISLIAGSKNITHYYTYGWQGAFGKKARIQAAKDLYISLQREVIALEQKGFNVKVRLVGYCHGGLVLSELATIASCYKEPPLIIDDAVFIGMPIPADVEKKLASSVFKKVWHVFSDADEVQPIDMFVTGKIRKERKIIVNDPILKAKLRQVQFFVRKYIGPKKMLDKIDLTQNKYNIPDRKWWRNVSPGHIELWFFGWTPSNYRKDWILYPMPAVSMLPFVFSYIDQLYDNFDTHEPIIFDLIPECHHVIIRQKNSDHVVHKKWLTHEQKEHLNMLIFQALPDPIKSQENYTNRKNFCIMRATKKYYKQKATVTI